MPESRVIAPFTSTVSLIMISPPSVVILAFRKVVEPSPVIVKSAPAVLERLITLLIATSPAPAFNCRPVAKPVNPPASFTVIVPDCVPLPITMVLKVLSIFCNSTSERSNVEPAAAPSPTPIVVAAAAPLRVTDCPDAPVEVSTALASMVMSSELSVMLPPLASNVTAPISSKVLAERLIPAEVIPLLISNVPALTVSAPLAMVPAVVIVPVLLSETAFVPAVIPLTV